MHQKDRFVRVLLNRVLEARGDFVKGLRPGNPLEAAFAAAADALHRVLEAFGRIEALAHGAAAVAGAHLREVLAGDARIRVARVVGLNADDAAVL